MSQWSKDAYSAGNILATEKGWVYTPNGEVLVADTAIVPTFTAPATATTTAN